MGSQWEEGELEGEKEPQTRSLITRWQSQESQERSGPTTGRSFMTLAKKPSRQVSCLWPLGCPWAGVALKRLEREGPNLGSHRHGSQVEAQHVPSQLCPGLAAQRADWGL